MTTLFLVLGWTAILLTLVGVIAIKNRPSTSSNQTEEVATETTNSGNWLGRVYRHPATPFVVAGLVGLGLFIGFWPSATWPIIKTGAWWLALATVGFVVFGYINIPTEAETTASRRRVAGWFRRYAVLAVIFGLLFGLWSNHSPVTVEEAVEAVGNWSPPTISLFSSSPERGRTRENRPPAPPPPPPEPFRVDRITAPTVGWSEKIEFNTRPWTRRFQLKAEVAAKDVPVLIKAGGRLIKTTLNKRSEQKEDIGNVPHLQIRSESGRPLTILVKRYR